MGLCELEKALMGTNDDVSFYLSEVSVKDFRCHMAEFAAKNADKAAIKSAIDELSKLL
jgi:hypothetical protein